MTRIAIDIRTMATLAGLCLPMLPTAAATQTTGEQAMAAAGKEIVETHCSPCHAVGLAGENQHPDRHACRIPENATEHMMSPERMRGL